MNANRTKYASTPTYGMQKRGFMKKAPVRQAPETPDFSQVPQPAPTMPPASPQTQQAFAQSVPPQGGFSGMPPYFSAPMQGTAQVPFASPSFIQPMAGQPPFQGFAPAPPHPCHRWATPHSAPLPRLSRRAVRALCPLRR